MGVRWSQDLSLYEGGDTPRNHIEQWQRGPDRPLRQRGVQAQARAQAQVLARARLTEPAVSDMSVGDSLRRYERST
jgi:hypothetical protein